ncbi:MAG: oxidoreductase [Herbaspirillum sp.]|nr:oxidoreductase [Herbaspirillum sp.]
MTILSCEHARADHLHATVCIVGAGAAGITLACELDGCGFKVLLLEAGAVKEQAGRSDYYEGKAERPHPATTEYRRTRFGGTTHIWGGRCVPFDPIDFERRDYIPHSGWPIAYDEVAQYYPKALAYCHAGAFGFAASSALDNAPPTISGFAGAGTVLNDLIERYSLPTDFGKHYRKQLARSANVTALLGARAVSLNKAGDSDRIASLTVADDSGREHTVHANVFVLATGGIEAPRLMLASDKNGPGLGNRHDLLGRFYACHFENTLGKLVANGESVAFDFEKTRDGVYCRRKLQFSAAAQREHRLLNTAFRLHFPDYADAAHGSAVMSTIFLAKSVLIKEYRTILQHNASDAIASPIGAHARNVATGLPQLLKFGYDWLFLRKLAERKLPYTLVRNADGSFPLEFNCEQTPQADSRITLGLEVDRHGMRRVHVNWKISEDDIDAAQRAFMLLRRTINASPRCRLEFDEAGLRARLAQSVPLGGHHIGAARMAASPMRGVVDSNCAVFDLPNLFIASSAVFPTSSHANPTLTIVALAVRMAKHLKSRLS